MSSAGRVCPICGSATVRVGVVFGRQALRDFHVSSCCQCQFSFVDDPLEDFSEVYDEAYYGGRGADPLVNYLDEVGDPERTIRKYEWRGVLTAVSTLEPITRSTKWLDLGCGLGGLVSYLRARGLNAVGADEGWGTDWCEQHGVPLVDAATTTEQFDVITAVEVIEHVPDPVAFLKRARNLLRPGGILWLTTGNAQPWRGRITEWPYVIPEIHVSFFEPKTMAIAMERAGLEVHPSAWTPGFADIVRFKVLKNLRRSRPGIVERLIPWSVASRAIDHRYRALEHPFGRAPRAAVASVGLTTR